MAKSGPLLVDKKTWFKAITVVAGIDIRGKVSPFSRSGIICKKKSPRANIKCCLFKQNNTIERLWAIAKRSFSKDYILEADFGNNILIQALVMKNLLEARSNSRSKHAFALLRFL